jgi:phosphatidylglycerophosphatase A
LQVSECVSDKVWRDKTKCDIDIFAVIGRSTYGKLDPRRFGSLGACFFTLFRLMTLDNWSDIYQDNKAHAPEIWAYLSVYIILETFVFLK